MAYLPDTEEQFRAAIAEAVEAKLPDAVAEGVRRALQKEYLTPGEVCQLTGWSRRKLAYLKKERAIPFVQRGRTVLFLYSGLIGYLSEGLVPAKVSGYTKK